MNFLKRDDDQVALHEKQTKKYKKILNFLILNLFSQRDRVPSSKEI